MDKLLLLVLGLMPLYVAEVSVINPLPDVVTSENEVFSFPLTNYFGGNNVNFSIADTTASDLDVQVSDPFNLSFQVSYNYSKPNLMNLGSQSGALLNIISQDGVTYVLNSYNSILQAVQVSATGNTTLLWSYNVSTSFQNPEIVRVAHYIAGMSEYACVLMRSQETIGTQGVFNRSDVYIINITIITKVPTVQQNLNLEDIRYFSKVDVLPLVTFNDVCILIVSCSEERSPTYIHDYLLAYNITDLKNVAFLQQVNEYKDIPGYPDGAPLHTVAMAFINDMLYVLDQDVGLVTFIIMEDYFLESDFIDIIRFGTPTSINVPYGPCKYLAVGTTNGLLLIDFVADDSEYKWIPTVLNDGIPWIPYSAVLSGSYIFANTQNSGNTSLLVIDYDEPFFSSVKRQWFLSTEIDENSFLPYGMYTLVQLQNPGSYAYFRSDIDALRVFLITVGQCVVKGTASAAGPYQATVIASDIQNPLSNDRLTLSVDYLSLKNTTVLFGSGYSLSSQANGIELVPDIIGATAFVSIPVSSLFSAPALELTLTFESIPQGIALNYTPSLEKLSLLVATAMPMLTQSATLVTASDGVLYVLNDTGILVFSYDAETITLVTTIHLDEKPVSVATDGLILYVLFSSNNLMKLRVFLVADYKIPSEITTVARTCETVKSLINYVYCISPSEIDIYQIDEDLMTLKRIFDIIPLRLIGLINDTLDVQDITEQFSEDAQRFFLYVSCRINGLFALDITGLEFNPDTLTVLPILPSAVLGVALSSPTTDLLVQTNSDGSVDVFDIENAPSVELVRTLPNWVEGNVVGTGRTESFALVYMNDSNLYFYDVFNTVHDSLFHIQSLDGFCSFLGTGTDLAVLCQQETGTNNLTVYYPNGQPGPTGFRYTFDVSIDLNLNQFISDEELVNGTLQAWSKFESGTVLTLPVTLDIESQGHIIFQNASSLPSSTLFVSYETSTNLDLTTVFSGQNLKMYLNINGVYPWFYYNETNYDPAILWPVDELTCLYEFPKETKVENETINGIVVLPNNVTLTIRVTDLGVFNISTTPPGIWNHVPNATLLKTYDLKEVLSNDDLQICPIISLVSASNEMALLAFHCSGQTAFASSGNDGETSFDLLAFVNFNQTDNSLSVAKSELLMFSPKSLKSRNSLTSREFYFLLIDSSEDKENNHLVWYQAEWMSNGEVNYTAKSIIVDFFKLGLDSLVVNDADILPIDTGAIIYIADDVFGLRIAEYTNSGEMSLIRSISLPVSNASYIPGDQLKSVCICGGLLFAMETSTITLRFNITNPSQQTNPVSLDPFQRYNTASRVFRSPTAELVCSNYNQGGYLVAGLKENSSPDYAFARIFNLDSDLDSAILLDIELGKAHGNLAFAFNYGNVLATLEPANFMFKIWYLRMPYLEFPVLTKSEYSSMVNTWNTSNFTLFITGTNEQMSLNSSTIALTRVGPPTPTPPNNGGDSSSYWWVWLIVAIAVVISFVGTYLGIRIYKRRQEEKRSLEKATEPFALNDLSGVDDGL